MAGAATNSTDDVSCEVTLLRTVVLAVANATTVLANLVFVITEGTIESREFAQLVSFVVVLSLGSGGSLGTQKHQLTFIH